MPFPYTFPFIFDPDQTIETDLTLLKRKSDLVLSKRTVKLSLLDRTLDLELKKHTANITLPDRTLELELIEKKQL